MLSTLKKVNTKNRKRVGRGISAGQGKTAGRGTKGQKSRSGYNIPRKFEGGQMPFSMRMPKIKGFKSRGREVIEISLDLISEKFKDGEKVTYESLKEKGIIKNVSDRVKILNNGELKPTVEILVPCSKSIVVKSKTKKTEEKPKEDK
jgi:large subunit ribosomal protein L15